MLIKKNVIWQKKSQKVGAFKLLTEELLGPHTADLNAYNELDEMLTKMSHKSNNASYE